jgi:phage terminase large subunit-like protein
VTPPTTNILPPRSSTSSLPAGLEPPEVEQFAAFCGELTLEDDSAMVLEPFQRRMVRDFFAGAIETLILVSKKNGKSSLLAALALYHLLVTVDAECVIAASSRDQATILLRQARGLIRRSPALSRLMTVKQREIVSTVDGGRIRVMASDENTADGVIPTLALVDELHRHKSADLYGVFRDGLGPRAGRMITISTAGDDETSPLGVMRAAAHKLPTVERDGAYRYCRNSDGSYVMHEWALEADDDLGDMDVVKRANPASWQTVEALRRRHESPSMTPWQWARFACGVWVKGEGSAIQPQDWDALFEDGVEIPAGSPVWVGMDLGWVKDTTALVPLWWEREDRRVIGEPVILEPPGDGTLLDDRKIVGALLGLADRFEVLGVVYDPAAGAQQMVQQLEREHDITFVEHSQKSSPMSLADGRLMEAIRRKALVHNGNRVLRQHVLNAVEVPLGPVFRFDRPKRGARVPVDALTALSMANSTAVAEAERSMEPMVAVFSR